MRHTISFCLILILGIPFMVAQTFHLDIAPIIYNNCTQCHRPGDIAPMSLITYDQVAENGYYIEYVTQSGYMPPWTPDHNYTTFLGERYLTDEEKQTISDYSKSLELNPNDNEAHMNRGLIYMKIGNQEKF